MANIKISELNPLLTVEDADVLPIVDNAVTKKVTAAILRSYTQGNSVLLTGAQTVAGIKTFTSQLASSVATGTAPFSVASTTKVTNLNADLLDGLSSADFQATLSGTGIVKSTAGTISYLTDNTANWDTAYNDKINSAAVTGSGTNTLTLTQQDAGTITATWVNGTLIREIRNTTGATLTKGTIVYISGATGNKPTVTKAIASGDSTSAQTFGFIQSDLANNANGYVVVVGDLTGVDTSAFAEGAQLYLSSTVAGTFTDVKQYAPAHLVYVGIVTRSHPTLGQIEVNIQNGYELDELHNVSAQSPSNGDILQFVTSTGLWTKVAGTTTNISEGTNLYFTNARSRSAFSESVTGLDYNSTTGVLSTTSGYGIPTTASQATWDTAYNDSIVSAAVTGTTTKTLTLNQQDGGTVTASWTDDNTDAVSSVFGRTGAVVAASGDYTTTQVTEGTNLYYTEARVNANTNVAANTAARHNAVTLGTANGLSLSTQQLSLGLASGSTTGALSSTDWTTFNNKQNALTNPITGTGTTNYLPKFTGTSALGDSNLISNSAGNLGLGIVPSTATGFKYIQFGAGAALSTNNTNNSNFYHNANFDASGNPLYAVSSQQSSYYRQINGQHAWAYAAAGTAGNAITFTNNMVLDTAGQLSTVGDATINGVKVGRGAGSIATNTAVGASALNANTTGNANSGFGANALASNITGGNNTAIGKDALFSNTASNNTAVGFEAGFTNASGTGLTAIGFRALKLSTGNNNTALGNQALLANTTGADNTAVGASALGTNTTGVSNIGIGLNALALNSVGSNNTAVGRGSLQNNTTSNNTALGFEAAYSNTSSGGITAIGYQALRLSTGGNNTALGYLALTANTTGTNNTGIGREALKSNTTGANNVGVGLGTLELNTASSNTAIGFAALNSNVTGSSNTALGSSALVANTASNNTAVGFEAAYSNTSASGNTILGYQAAKANSTGANNSIIGFGQVCTNFSGVSMIGVADTATAANQMRFGSATVSNGAVATETVVSDRTWSVFINGVAYKILLKA